jgi:putative ABC transport system permease protein
MDGVQYQIVGVNGQGYGTISIGSNPPNTVYIPYTTLAQIYNTQISLIAYTVKPGYAVSDVQDKVEELLKRNHHISPKDTQAVQKINTEAIFNVVDSLFKGISILVWMIGLGTLIAGAIGVSNIMMVTVKERTSEIGIRRAIGATPKDILVQTMSESLVLTLIAGISGICFAVFILAILETNSDESFSGANFQVPFWTAVGTTLLLSLLGILAGAAPTLRAMSIKPVDAMREE